MNRPFVFLIIVFLFGCREKEDEALETIFFERSVEGGILISALDEKIEFIFNKKRQETSYSPDATFYILSSIIALDEKLWVDEQQSIFWDGEDRGLAEWNRDQSLETAYKYSCLWANQKIIERIGISRFASILKKTEYGNGETGNNSLDFWLNGNLNINSRQQIDFLRRLYKGRLPFGKTAQQTVKRWMMVRKTNDYTLYSKTAWASHTTEQHGWNVGFIETQNRGTWFFALNMKIEQASLAPFRQEIIEEALRKKGIIR
jgi:beta-lactamase class D